MPINKGMQDIYGSKKVITLHCYGYIQDFREMREL